MTMAEMGLTSPAAGVMATSPTTMPVAMPMAVAFPVRMMSSMLHTASVAMGASIVFTSQRGAGVAPSALPP